MLNADQLPTLWDPEDLFSHLALWAGAPAVVVAVVVWLLGLYQSVKGWTDVTKSAAEGVRNTKAGLQNMISVRKRAAARMALCSVLMVGFSYMLAVIINAFVQLIRQDPNANLTSELVENSVSVTALSPAAVWTVIVGIGGVGLLGIATIAKLTGLRKFVTFVGSTACVLAWIVGSLLAVGAVFGLIGLGILKPGSSTPPPPVPLLITEAITSALCIAVGWLLPKIRKACSTAFDPR